MRGWQSQVMLWSGWWLLAGQGVAGTPARPVVELTLAQRTTAVLPGWDEGLSVRIGDITAGQVTAEVLSAQRTLLAGPRSLRTGEVLPYRAGDQHFTLRLEQLDNALVGQDYARFRVVPAGSPAPAPVPAPLAAAPAPVSAQIEQLLTQLGSLADVRFVRNGRSYGAADAVQHLRQKWAHRRIETVEQFIARCATVSEASGLPYLLRWPDGREQELAEYLRSIQP